LGKSSAANRAYLPICDLSWSTRLLTSARLSPDVGTTKKEVVMAKPSAVWGIDIGQSALKALRCRPGEEGGRITADAFDYIEYPKLLSQPDADASELVHDALKTFLSRNSLRGDRVVISVSGQSGLARFIKLPPVESSKIPDIVKYEAKQQIPFPLEDVVWDYQQMMGSSTSEGFALDAEVGLFAMKRDQVYKVLQPFDRVDVEVDVIQLTPLALYNYVVFDQFTDLPSIDDYDPENPPKSLVVLSLGTETTDLVVTNGFRVWQRSIPIGGNHFTKALTKELKLNFATAEHLKRNASQAEDPKALFQAMRPVFNDLLTEVQRSLGYFKNIDRTADISRVVALGNVMKLPGLQRYLQQNLGYDLAKVDSFRGLSGSGVVDAPAFKENLLAYGVCYGLCLQGLRAGKLDTNLLPREIMRYRMIRAKKPWVAAAAALLLLGCSASYFRHFTALESVSLDPASPNSFSTAKQSADGFIRDAGEWEQHFDEAKTVFVKTDEVGQSLLQNMTHRELWLRLLKAVNVCLPRNGDAKERPKDIAKREEIKCDAFECRWVERLEDWHAETLKHNQKGTSPPADAAVPPPMDPTAMAEDANAPPPDPNAPPPPAMPAGPTGPGWVFKVDAHHYHNGDPRNEGVTFVRNTLLKNLAQDEMPLPTSQRVDGGPKFFPVKKLGIEYPMMLGRPLPEQYQLALSEEEQGDNNGAMFGEQQQQSKFQTLTRLDFTIEFCWRPPSDQKPAVQDAGSATPEGQPAAGANDQAAQP
jgi:type IV pilus assembly protein PilM